MLYEEPIDSGARLAAEAAASATLRAEEYCNHECTRIALAHEPRVNVLQAEGRQLTEQSARLESRLRALPPPMGDPAARARSRRYYYAIGGILTLAAFAFTVIGLAPYRLGSIGILYSLGIAVATPFVVDEFLDLWQAAGVLKTVAAGVFVAALLGGILLVLAII